MKSYDINRRLAIFYHPLFIEIISLFTNLLGGDKYGFIPFVEMNIRLQRVLLIEFNIKNAFMSALNDWVKEIQDCQQLKQLYKEIEIDIQNEIQQLKFEPILQAFDYEDFQQSFKDHQAYKYLHVKINQEIISKFFFDLCTTWCQHLDLELFSYFLVNLYFGISDGDALISSEMLPLQDIDTLLDSFFDELQNQIQLYGRYKKKNLQYYRAWCEWNYLRIEEIGEAIISRICDYFPEDKRIDELVGIFVKSIHQVNKEITQQISRPTTIQQDPQLESSKFTDEALNWYEQNKSHNTHVEELLSKAQVSVLECQAFLQKVDPLPPDLFFIRFNDVEGNFVLERKINLPVFGQAKELVKLKQTQRKITEREIKPVFYIADPPQKQELPDLPSKFKIKKMNRPTKSVSVHQKTKSDNNTKMDDKSFDQKQDTESVLVPQFAGEINPFSGQIQRPSRSFHRIHELYGQDINQRKRDISKDIPLVIIRGQSRPSANDFALPDRPYSQLHNTKLTFKQHEQIKETRHLWESVMTQEEMEVLRQDEEKFYHILNLLKIKFNQENQSDYLKQLNIKINYGSKRDDMGGKITAEQMKKFHERIQEILERNKHRKKRRRRRRKLNQINMCLISFYLLSKAIQNYKIQDIKY
ncbi:hypothetical protein pb186bvf_009525 [Paramecium bursaria]